MDRELISLDQMVSFDLYRLGVCKSVEHHVEALKLEPYWQFYNNTNRAKGLAYHNHIHTCWMMSEVGAMAVESSLNVEEARALVLAAMFHDYCHSGGLTDDSENVTRAVDGFKIACIQANYDVVSEEMFHRVIDLIRVTEYPFIREPKTVSEQIIRDADVLYGCGGYFKKIIYIDLFSELLVSKPDMSFMMFVEGQKQFIKNVRLFMPNNQRRFNRHLCERLKPFWDRLFLYVS